MSERFFVPSPVQSAVVQLDEAESHHLLHVMRARPGTEVVLFDGSGCEYQARVCQATRRHVCVEVLCRREIDREAKRELVLGVALPKRDCQSWLVEKAVEIGVRRLIPLVTARTVATPSPGALKRLRRVVIESSKQCGRNRLMAIDEAEHLEAYLVRAPKDASRWLLHAQPEKPESHAGSPAARLAASDSPLYAAVGPEGGFTPDEVQTAVEQGWALLWLGPRILRVETAALVVAALAVTA